MVYNLISFITFIYLLTQSKGKESENSYRKLKNSRWTATRTHTHTRKQSKYFDGHGRPSQTASIFGKSSHFPFPYFVYHITLHSGRRYVVILYTSEYMSLLYPTFHYFPRTTHSVFLYLPIVPIKKYKY